MNTDVVTLNPFETGKQPIPPKAVLEAQKTQFSNAEGDKNALGIGLNVNAKIDPNTYYQAGAVVIVVIIIGTVSFFVLKNMLAPKG